MAVRTSENQSSPGLAAPGYAIFLVVLLVAFFLYRGADIGQMPQMIGNFGGLPFLRFEGLWDSVVGSIVAVLIGVAWFGLGDFVLSFIPVSRGENYLRMLDIVTKAAVGAAIWSLIWFFIGIAGAYTGVVAIAAVVIGLALAVFSAKRLRAPKGDGRVPEKYQFFKKVLLILIAIPLVLAFIASLAPPTAKDTLIYHFALPKAFVAQGGNAIIEGNIASYLALGTEMHTVWAMLLGGFVGGRAGDAAAGATVFLLFPLLLFAIYGWAREAGISKSWSLIAVLMVATVPTAFHVASSGYIDIALALFVTLAIRALSRWWSTRERGSLVLIAIFLGAALAIKLTALFVFAAFALIILLRARDVKDAGRVVAGGSAALVLALVIASPWYLRTWKATGSPVFPFYMSIWKAEAPGWDVERSNLFQAMNTEYGGAEKTAVNYLLAPWNLSITAQPEIAEHFDGVLGISFLFGLPILIWGLWKFDLPVEAKIGAGVAAIMFLFWLFSSQQLRYLLPILPVLAIAIIAAAAAISKGANTQRRVWQYGFGLAGIAGILVTAAWFCQRAPLRVALGGETRDQYLTRNLDYYPYYQTLNTDTEPDAKVWLINMRRDTYNLDRPVFSDYLFEDWTLRKMVWESRSAQELRAKTAAMGIKYVLTRHDFIFDYDRSTLVDDKKSRAENDARLKIAKEFILDPTNTIRADNKFSLIKVF